MITMYNFFLTTLRHAYVYKLNPDDQKITFANASTALAHGNESPYHSICRLAWSGLSSNSGQKSPVRWTLLLLALMGALLISFGHPNKCFAQAVSWSELDINQPPAAGSFSYTSGTPPTYTTNGSGVGVASAYDQIGYSSASTCGNIEIEGQLTSQSSTTSGALSALMVRDSLDIAAGMGAIGVTVTGSGTGTVNFYYRPHGGSATTVTGTSVTLPVYLRLTVNAGTITGLYSTDNETWTSVGSTSSVAIPNLYYVGFASSNNSGTNTTNNSSVFKYITYDTSVPSTANMLLWLRSDVGVVSSSGNVSQWTDQSGQGNNATQTTGTKQPSLTTGAINSGVLPTITFNGTSQFMSCPSGFANLRPGFSAFIVLKPTSSSATGTPCYFGGASNNSSVFAQTIGQNAALYAYSGATSSNITTTTNPLSNSSYQLLEETLLPGATAGTGTGTIFVNGTQIAQSTSMQNLGNLTRAFNYIGQGYGGVNFFQGGIAEIIVYSTCVSAAQRKSIEAYVLGKYGIGSTPTLDAPTFSPASGVYSINQPISILQDQGATSWFTTNGTTPVPNNPSSQWFDSIPISLYDTPLTIQAVASAPFFANSSVSTMTAQVEQNSVSLPRNGLMLWLRGDNSVTTSGSNVTSWGDVSGSYNNATQSVSTNQPTLVQNAFNGYPAVSFNGTSQFLQLPAGFANLTPGATIMAVINPNSTMSFGQRILDFGNAAASDNIFLMEGNSNTSILETLVLASQTNVNSTALTPNNYQLVEAIDNGSGTATIYLNGVFSAQNTAMNTMNNVTRTLNFIGQGAGGGHFFKGQIAELLVWNRGLSATEQANVEGYLFQKYNLLSASTTPAPLFSVGSGTYTSPTQIAIEAPAAATIYVTTDGTTPTTSSPVYTGPITVYQTTTVKAIAVINGLSSNVTTATLTLNATQWPAPGTTSTPLQINTQLPSVAIPQDPNQH